MANLDQARKVAAWQSTLDQLKQDGTFERIYHSYPPGAQLSDLLER